MSDKTILITGATSGIGLDTALYLHEMGYKLFLIGRNEEKLREVSEKTGDSPFFVLDLEETERICEITDYCKENNILVDGVVHSAGCGIFMPLRYFGMEHAEKLMKIHYYAFIELCKNLYSKRIIKEGGSIVALSSLSSIMQVKGYALYASAKSALNEAVLVASQEFTKRSIRVNALLPANVDTRMTATIKDDIAMSELQPFGIIPPRDIAYAVEFLLSDKSRYITGALIPITAGMKY